MKALIAMSGGVDSSVTAQIMSKEGYECVGCTMCLFDDDMIGKNISDGCGSPENTKDAKSVTDSIGINHHIFHYEQQFKDKVIEPFVKTYEQGYTPNPCIECNRWMKFGYLFDQMKKLGCDCLATGHYARTDYDSSTGRYLLKKALDDTKDQSYVLYTLTQYQLEHIRFPLGNMTKDHTRQVAYENGFKNADRKDSQDICFVPDGDYVAFMERYRNKHYPEGDFVDRNGNVLGRHKGYVHYTIGQRKGLGVAAGHPIFVVDIDPVNNRVILGENEELFKSELIANDINLISVSKIEGDMRVKAKIRYRHKEQPATVTQIGEDTIRVVFDEPQRAITKGQAVVMYDGDVVVGGGTIC